MPGELEHLVGGAAAAFQHDAFSRQAKCHGEDPDDFRVRLPLFRGRANRDDELPGTDSDHAVLSGVRLCFHPQQHRLISHRTEARLVHARTFSPHLEAHPVAPARPFCNDEVGTPRQRDTNP